MVASRGLHLDEQLAARPKIRSDWTVEASTQT